LYEVCADIGVKKERNTYLLEYAQNICLDMQILIIYFLQKGDVTSHWTGMGKRLVNAGFLK
jgi:hypothetical protein